MRAKLLMATTIHSHEVNTDYRSCVMATASDLHYWWNTLLARHYSTDAGYSLSYSANEQNHQIHSPRKDADSELVK